MLVWSLTNFFSFGSIQMIKKTHIGLWKCYHDNWCIKTLLTLSVKELGSLFFFSEGDSPIFLSELEAHTTAAWKHSGCFIQKELRWWVCWIIESALRDYHCCPHASQPLILIISSKLMCFLLFLSIMNQNLWLPSVKQLNVVLTSKLIM